MYASICMLKVACIICNCHKRQQFLGQHVCWVQFTKHCLSHWGRDKMAAILQMTFSNTLFWMKTFEFRLKFHWSLFLRVQLTISQHRFREWLGADQATSHYLNQWCPRLSTYIYVTPPQWVNTATCADIIDYDHWHQTDGITLKNAFWMIQLSKGGINEKNLGKSIFILDHMSQSGWNKMAVIPEGQIDYKSPLFLVMN